jgi:hypothetical protein
MLHFVVRRKLTPVAATTMITVPRTNAGIERSIKFLLAVFVCAGWSAFWSRNYAFPSMPSELHHPNMEAQPAWRSGNLSPKAAAIIESSVKGSERTLANNWSFSEESRGRVNEISRNYALSPEDQKRSDESNRRTAESLGLAKKSAYLPRN